MTKHEVELLSILMQYKKEDNITHVTNLSFRKAVSLDLLYYINYTTTNTMHNILLLCLHELNCLYCVQLGLGLILKYYKMSE